MPGSRVSAPRLARDARHRGSRARARARRPRDPGPGDTPATASARRRAVNPSTSRNAPSAFRSGGSTGRVALGEPRRQPVEEQVDRAWRLLAAAGAACAASASLADVWLAAEATGEHRCRHRLEMRLASHRGVERLEAPGGIEQQGRSVAAARARERDLRAQPLQPGALKLVERGKLGGRQQLERRVRCPGIELRLRGSQGPPASLRRIRASAPPRAPGTPRPPPRRHGPAPGRPSAPTRRPPPRRHPPPREHDATPDDRDRYPDRSPPPTPGAQLAARKGPPPGIPRIAPVDAGSGHGLRPRRAARPLPGRASSVRCRAREPRARRASRHRSARPRPAAAVAGLPRAARRRAGDSDPRGGAGGLWQRRSSKPPASSAALMLRGRSSSASGLPRVSATMRSRTRSSSRPGTALHEQGARILLGQPAQQQLGQAVEVVPGVRLADGDHHRHRFRQQPSRDEAEDQSRGVVQPLGVLHETEQRPLLGRGGQQAEHGESDQEPVRDVTGCEAQGDVQRVLLRLRQRVELVEQRRAELMDPGERQLHLRLHARDLRHTESRGMTRGVPEQRRLSDARLASDDQNGALTLARLREEPVEHFALAGPVEQPGRRGDGHRDGS